MAPDVSKLKFKIITPDLKLATIEFLDQFFYRDGPLNSCLNILSDPKAANIVEEHTSKLIDDNISVMAVTKSNEIVGVALSSVQRKKDLTKRSGIKTGTQCDEVSKFLGFLEKQVDTFGRFPDLNEYVLLDVLSVDSSWRGVGLSKVLLSKIRDLVATKGYGLIRINCTSSFSARAAERSGYQLGYSIGYDQYKVDGRQVLKVALPHTEARSYFLELK